MRPANYLVFGDLHGRVLPAFRLAQAWSREHGVALDGLLQVGDLGDTRSDGGMRLVARPSDVADEVFANETATGPMWFTAGNHEDYALLEECQRDAGRGADSFAIDAYGKLRCVNDGRVATLPGGLRVGALWGIDDKAPNARERIPPRARIRRRASDALCATSFDVLLTHESPRDAILAGSGGEEVGEVIRRARPAIAFFGHYHPTGRRVEGDFGATRVYHLCHLELDSRAEAGSVGVLRWDSAEGGFSYIDPEWLRTVTRSNWRHR